MNRFQCRRRDGMTLIELLVVVAIIGLLAVTVLPSLADTAESRRGREATQVLTSFIAKAQSRALGRAEWSGFMLMPTGSTSYAAVDLVSADVPPVYSGDTVPALVTINVLSSGTMASVTGTTGQLATSTHLGLVAGDRIRFSSLDTWYELAAPATTGTSLFFCLPSGTGSANAGYTAHNTAWPPTDIPLSFEVQRKPAASGTPFSLPESRVIDLYWSGYGPPLANDPTNFNRFDVTGSGTNPVWGSTTTILFDGAGRLRQIQVERNGSTRRLAVTGPIFLLLGRADRVITNPGDLNDVNQPGNRNPADDSTGANWQYSDSYWIAVDPLTGVAKSAKCMATGTSVVDSQRWIRDALGTGSD